MTVIFTKITGCQRPCLTQYGYRVSSEVCRIRAGAALVATATEASTSTIVASLGPTAKITSFLGLLMDLYKCFQNGHFVTKFIEMSIGRFSDQGECIAEGLLDRVAIAFPDLGHCLDKCRAWIAWIRCMTEDTGPISVPIWDENVPCTYIPPPMPFDTGGVGRAGSSCQCSILQ